LAAPGCQAAKQCRASIISLLEIFCPFFLPILRFEHCYTCFQASALRTSFIYLDLIRPFFYTAPATLNSFPHHSVTLSNRAESCSTLLSISPSRRLFWESRRIYPFHVRLRSFIS
jgi:hypothetical protein